MIFNFDSNGLIVTFAGDGGDSAANESRWLIGNYLLTNKFDDESFLHSMNVLQVAPAVFVRNPNHYNDPKDFSRDQSTPLIVAMGFYKYKSVLKKMFWKQVKNFFRYQNNDIGTFEDLNLYIRAMGWWFLYPLLLVGDLFSVISSLILVFWTTREPNHLFKFLDQKFGFWWLTCNAPPNAQGVPQEKRGAYCTSNDLNRTVTLLQAVKTYPTPLSWLSRMIYKNFRPNSVNWAWGQYFLNDNPFAELYYPIINEYLL